MSLQCLQNENFPHAGRQYIQVELSSLYTWWHRT